MDYQTLIVKLDSEIATLTLNRPERRNAISPEMILEFMTAFDEIESSSAKVLILTGAGKAFSAGMDLAALRAMASPASQERSDQLSRENSQQVATLFRRIFDFPKVTIAAVDGPAIAGGCGIAAFCDFTLASPEAKFGYTEVRIGFMPALVSVFLIRQIGEKRARDLLLSGRIIGAEEACRLGLVNEVVPADRLLERARELAGQLLEVSPTSLVHTKRLLREFSQATLDRELEIAIRANAGIRATEDFREGLSAFFEKRKPVWHGR
jgi:methylglutaconyl-CoA hydratase